MSRREIRMTMPVRLSLPLCAAAALLWPAVIAQNAAAQTYTPTSGTFQWSAGTNWSATPVSGSTTRLTYVGTNATVIAAGTYGSNNDLSGNFRLNILDLQGTGPASGNAVINLSGGPLEFVSNGATTPVINLNATGTSLSYNVANNLVLTNNLALNGAGTANYTFSGLISGTGSFNKSANNANTITLTNNASTFTGGVSIGSSGGVVRYSSIADNGVASSLGVGTASNRIFLNQSSSLTYTGSLDQSSNRRIEFAGSNASTLATSGSGGTLTFSNVASLAAGSSLSLNAAAGTTIVIANTIGTWGSGGFGKSGAGTAMFTAAQNYTGKTTLSGGNLVITSIANVGTASALGAGSAGSGDIRFASGGAIKYVGSGHDTNRLFEFNLSNVANTGGVIDASGSGPLKFTSSGTLGFSANNGGFLYLTGTSTADNTLAPVLTNTPTPAAMGITKYGAGKWILTGSHTYTGQTRAYDGSLVLNAATGAISGSSAVAFGGGRFTIDNTGATGALTIASGTLTATAGDGVMTFARTAAQDVGITFAGNSRSVGATVNLAHGGGANSATNGFSITGAATGFVNQGLFFSGADYAYMNSAGGFVRAPVYGTDTGFVNASGSLTTGATNHNLVQSSLTGAATGTVATIKFSGASAVNLTQNASTTLTLASGGLLRAGGGATTIAGATLSTANNAEYVFRVDSTSDSLTINSVIAANNSNVLTKSGAGTLTLGGANDYTQPTYVNGGTLVISSNGNLGRQNQGQRIEINNATLRATADVGLFNGSAGTNNRNVVITNAATFDVDANRTLTIAGVVSGTNLPGYAYMHGGGRLIKTGAGTLALSNANTYTGDTTISAGVLAITAGNINSTSGITIGGGELKYNSSTALAAAVPLTFTAGTLSGTGTINTPVTVGAGAIHSPGNSPGTQTVSVETWAPGGTYLWEINDWNGGVGTAFDQINVTNTLGITATSGSTFKIAITGLTSGNAVGVVPNFTNTARKSFQIATSGSVSGFAANKFQLDTSSFAPSNSLANGGFTIAASATDVSLTFIPSAVYTLSSTASATSIRVGGSSTITATITSSTATVTNPDSLAYTGFGLPNGLGTLSASGTLAPGASASGNAVFTGTAAGAFTFTPSITSGSNTTINTAANAGAATGATVNVYNLAAANTLSTPINLGTVLKGTSLSQALSITNTAPNDGFSEKLDATFGTLTDDASTNGGSISLLAAGSTSTAMTVGLGSATAGAKSGSVQLNFASNGDGTSGLAPLALDPQTVSLTATVLDPARASFEAGPTPSTSLLLSFGDVNQNASVSPLNFSLFNLMQTNGFTADLALYEIITGTGNTNAITTTLSQFNTLAPGSSNAYSASFATNTLGAFQNTYTLRFKSSSGGVGYANDTPQSLTLTVTGVIIVPEPGSLALAGIGIAAAAYALRSRSPSRKRAG